MKKIILSAAVAAMAFSTSAVAADKGIDIDVSGQAVLYYETHSSDAKGDKGQFDQDNSKAAAGIQLNIGSDLGNNFTFGSQISYLGSLGLGKTIVSAKKQSAGAEGSTTNELALTKIFIAKKMGNTTIKAGRQELPKSLSPLAFSEGWNVFKNTFDAVLAINTDLPKTTLVGAYVTGGTGMGLGTSGDISGIAGATYMATAQTKLIPATIFTASYYAAKNVGGVEATDATTIVGSFNGTPGTFTVNNAVAGKSGIGADALWLDAKIKLPANIGLDLQYGNIDPDGTLDDTTAYGAKLHTKIGKVALKAIYTTVDGSKNGSIKVANFGTGIKTALYSQMMYNQNLITLDNDTIVVGAAYDAGSIGKFAVNYGMSKVGQYNAANSAGKDQDYNELDVVYKVKAGGIQYFAIAAIRDWDKGLDGDKVASNTAQGADATKDTSIRFWARYNF